MAVQQNKKSRSRKGMRRSHDRIAVPSVIVCTCGSYTLPHRICPTCGKYHQVSYTKPKAESTNV
ncbi:MAG: 50S ribosomal protein L32 [Desulfovibrio sp.]|nr:50S ribosomal protein L32 [Desulfovibrio sp.]